MKVPCCSTAQAGEGNRAVETVSEKAVKRIETDELKLFQEWEDIR